MAHPIEIEESVSVFDSACMSISQENMFTPRESEVLLLLAKGHGRSYICEKLFLSKDTIKTHARNIYRKLSIHSQQEVITLVEKRMEEIELKET